MNRNLAISGPVAKRRVAASPASEDAARELLLWYDRHARILPWRVGPAQRRSGLRPDPYRVWLSEVMLQQTTVKAVAPYFHRFVSRWPSVGALAAAPDEAVMAAWAGLGYYSRARKLIECARTVAARPGSLFPASAAELSALPGVGPYTSAAIAALAFDQRIAVVDGNVERVLSRFFAIGSAPPVLKEDVRQRLQPLVPPDRPGEFAEALMDLGATICTPRKPACALCPWSEPCAARREGRQLEFPRKAEKRRRPTRYGHAFVAARSDGAILLRRRPARGLLGGMCEVPGSAWTEAQPSAPVPPIEAEWTTLPKEVEHGFTHFELRLVVHLACVPSGTPAPDGHWWSTPERLPDEALPSVTRKVITAALDWPGRSSR